MEHKTVKLSICIFDLFADENELSCSHLLTLLSVPVWQDKQNKKQGNPTRGKFAADNHVTSCNQDPFSRE